MNIVAIDPSLTSLGYASGSGSGVLTPPASTNRGTDRLRWLRARVLELVVGADLVAIEGYSFASRGRAIISLGELGGVLRCAFADAGVRWVEIPPPSRALFATGKGNSSKEHVLVEAVRQLGYTGHSNDEADALWLFRMAQAQYGVGAPVSNQTQRRALAAIEWPAHAGFITVSSSPGV